MLYIFHETDIITSKGTALVSLKYCKILLPCYKRNYFIKSFLPLIQVCLYYMRCLNENKFVFIKKSMAESVKIRENEDDEGRKMCPLCLKVEAKYTCPRCQSPYCSVDCYRSEKHMNCSESFYKDCFMEGIFSLILID